MTALTDRLRPRSAEGDVYRDRWVEHFEPIFYVFGLVGALVTASTSVSRGDWLQGAGFLAVIAVIMIVPRLVFFRPHLVIGNGVLVLAGVTRTRRIFLADVRRAVAAKGALKLVLVNGDEVYVPGHFLWNHAHGTSYSYVADRINASVAATRITPAAKNRT